MKRVKFGIDPTGKTIHLGRTVPLLQLKRMQELGDTIVLIIGDFTAMIGDASDKSSKRPKLTKEDVQENMKNYLPLIGKILDLEKCEVHYNSTWLSTLSSDKLIELMDLFTVQQMLARRNFKERYESTQKGGNPISFKEFIYPVLQGYDSYAISADVEIGGSDQIFNMNAGRDIQKHFGMEPQAVITTPLILGTNGNKMSTSEGNVINITDEPKVMFDKVMSIRDDFMLDYWKNCTLSEEWKIVEQEIENSTIDWRKRKMELAQIIVNMYT